MHVVKFFANTISRIRKYSRVPNYWTVPNKRSGGTKSKWNQLSRAKWYLNNWPSVVFFETHIILCRIFSWCKEFSYQTFNYFEHIVVLEVHHKSSRCDLFTDFYCFYSNDSIRYEKKLIEQCLIIDQLGKKPKWK